MTAPLPELYFRVRENGAVVFRLDTETRQGRIEMEQVAVVNVTRGEIKPQGDRPLTGTERRQVEDWIAARQALLAARALDDIHRTVDHLNLTAQWAQSKASADELEEVTDDLLLAMHDLREVLVRKKADRLTKKG